MSSESSQPELLHVRNVLAHNMPIYITFQGQEFESIQHFLESKNYTIKELVNIILQKYFTNTFFMDILQRFVKQETMEIQFDLDGNINDKFGKSLDIFKCIVKTSTKPDSKKKTVHPYYGDTKCQKIYSTKTNKSQLCKNNAYVRMGQEYFCNVHCKDPDKIELKKRSAKEKKEMQQKLLDDHKKTIKDARKENKENNQFGKIILTKLKMMKTVVLVPGYLNVFPNFKHDNRSDGFGCKSLSPKFMGPITSDILFKLFNYRPVGSAVIVAQTIEGYHQYNKVFPFEVKCTRKETKSDICKIYFLLPEFFKIQKKGYMSKDPWRHKYGPTLPDHKKTLEEKGVILKESDNVNKPLFSIVPNNKGQYETYTYAESRYFYSMLYEYFATGSCDSSAINLEESKQDYQKILSKLKKGININIVGFDARSINTEIKDKVELTETLYKMYLDTRKGMVFGHELVLASLLYRDLGMITEVPWRIKGKPKSDKIIEVWKG